MKTILIYSLLVVYLVANAQPLTFSMGIKADKSQSQKDLYKQGKHWFNNVFDAANKKLTLDDPSQGIIVGKGSFAYEPKVKVWSAKTKGTVEYQIKLSFKEGRYEYEISNFKHQGSGISFDLITQDQICNKDVAEGATQEWKNEVWNDIKSQAEANTKGIIKSFISTISQPGTMSR